MSKVAVLAMGVAGSVACWSFPAAAQSTVEAIKKRGELLCGVRGRSQGFSFIQQVGNDGLMHPLPLR